MVKLVSTVSQPNPHAQVLPTDSAETFEGGCRWTHFPKLRWHRSSPACLKGTRAAVLDQQKSSWVKFLTAGVRRDGTENPGGLQKEGARGFSRAAVITNDGSAQQCLVGTMVKDTESALGILQQE